MYGNERPENYLEVSREALLYNAQAVRRHVGVPVIGVVKCDGYGVSTLEAALAWQKAGAVMFAVSAPQDALLLRDAGFREDILLLTPVWDPETLSDLLRRDILLPVTSYETAQFYSSHARGTLRVHVAVDTGMGRFGVRWTDLEQLHAIYNTPGLRFEGIYSHLARSFEKQYRYTKLQLDRFLELTKTLESSGYPLGMRHIANSCAALRFPQTRLDAVRVGSALVGALCGKSPIPLQPATAFYARVLDKKSLCSGDTTGYAALYRVRRHTTAAVVALGNEDGFGITGRPDRLRLQDLASWLLHILRGYRHPPCVLWKDKPLPMIGRVGNQFTLFDATGLDLRPGDLVRCQVPILFPHSRRTFR